MTSTTTITLDTFNEVQIFKKLSYLPATANNDEGLGLLAAQETHDVSVVTEPRTQERQVFGETMSRWFLSHHKTTTPTKLENCCSIRKINLVIDKSVAHL